MEINVKSSGSKYCTVLGPISPITVILNDYEFLINI